MISSESNEDRLYCNFSIRRIVWRFVERLTSGGEWEKSGVEWGKMAVDGF